MKKDVIKNFAKLTGKHLCQGLLFNKVAGLRLFPVNIVKFLRTPFLQNTSEQLLVLLVSLVLISLLSIIVQKNLKMHVFYCSS